jgi:Gnt-I system low-affinity gluconate transporter
VIIAGPVFARRWRHLPAEAFLEHVVFASDTPAEKRISFGLSEALLLILLPLVLIITSTVAAQFLEPSTLLSALTFIGHPFTALALTTLIAFIRLRMQGADRDQIGHCMGNALEPAGVVVLVTGAGGVFKQILTDSGAGLVLADTIAATGALPVVFAFLVALLVRISQGSATVAMITAAGLVAPMQESLGITGAHSALLVVAIAAGAASFSHVNDSGFWLVSRYLHMDTTQTLKTWTVMSALIGIISFAMVMLVSMLV